MNEGFPSFSTQCRNNYFNKITPAGKGLVDSEGYQRLVTIAQHYFEQGALEEFTKYFEYTQYFVQLWAAHLVLEYGKPSDLLKNEAIRIITSYSTNKLAPEVSGEEEAWLRASAIGGRPMAG